LPPGVVVRKGPRFTEYKRAVKKLSGLRFGFPTTPCQVPLSEKVIVGCPNGIVIVVKVEVA